MYDQNNQSSLDELIIFRISESQNDMMQLFYYIYQPWAEIVWKDVKNPFIVQLNQLSRFLISHINI